jgi:hypothetical protein
VVRKQRYFLDQLVHQDSSLIGCSGVPDGLDVDVSEQRGELLELSGDVGRLARDAFVFLGRYVARVDLLP